MYNNLGQYQRAIDFYQQWLEIAYEIGDRSGEATSLMNLGTVYNNLGQYQRAIDYLQQSLAIQQEIGDRNGEASSLWNLSNSYQRQGKIRKVRECRIAAVRIWQSLNLPIDAVPFPEIMKRMYRTLEQQGKDWAESFIQAQEQLGWLMDIIAGVRFLIFLPTRLFQQFKTFSFSGLQSSLPRD